MRRVPVRSLVWLAALAGLAEPGRALGQWTFDSLSPGRAALAATVAQDEVFLAGGYSTHIPFGNSSSAQVDIFDTVACTWRAESLSAPRRYLSAATVGSKVLFAGGADTQPSGVVDLYDTGTDTWSTAQLSLPRLCMGAVSVGTQALFAGGCLIFAQTAVVDIYDSATGQWTTSALSETCTGMGTASVGSLAFFAGGAGDGMTRRDVVDIYDASTGLWSIATLSEARWSVVGATVGTKVLFAGGTATASIDFSDVVDIYDSATGVWTTAALSVPRGSIVAATVGSQVIFAGGQEVGSVSSAVDIYDDATGSWSTSTLPFPVLESAAAAAGGRAYFAGGSVSNAAQAHIQIFTPYIGASYCPSRPNSTGVHGTLTVDGSLVSALNDLRLTATDLPPGELGYFIAGRTQGLFVPPGAEGPLCLAGNVGRFDRPSQVLAGPTGCLTLDLTAIPVHPARAVGPGETWNFQCWYRDGSRSNFTDAVAVAFQ